MREIGIHLADIEIEEIIRQNSINGNEPIDFFDFANLMTRSYEKNEEKEIQEVFERMDLDKTKILSADNLIEALRKVDIRIDRVEADEMIAENDIDGDGVVSFADFASNLKG